jgi:catechol 2,3-dioxygenase-like lactoylglutathione lyase family enzyme
MSEAFPFHLHYHHVGIFVSDMEQSAKWYEEMLGYRMMFKKVFDLPNQGPVLMAWMKHGEHYIELYEYAKDPISGGRQRPFNMADYLGTLGTKHLCLYVRDAEFEGLKKYLEDKGANFTVKHRWTEEQTEKPGGCGVIYITDPDGIWIEIQEEFAPGEYGR